MLWWQRRPFATVLVWVGVAYADLCDSDESCPQNMASAEDADTSSLLQVPHVRLEDKSPGSKYVFMSTPFNFEDTVEKVAMFKPGTSRKDALGVFFSPNSSSWHYMNRLKQPGGELWGRTNPDLQVISNVTKCPLYYTPQKYWPADIAKKYFGNKTVFGIIRDPYEKLVAQFRGGMANYGGTDDAAKGICDVNTAVKKLLKQLKASGDMFQGGCTNIPQAEFYEGPYGITIPIDNWRFPYSANAFFAKHGFPYHITQEDIIHVRLCNDHWDLEFDNETRALVRELYSQDFDIMCKSFGHCDFDQVTCLQGIHGMCPETVFEWDFDKGCYCPVTEELYGPGLEDALGKPRTWPECVTAAGA